MVTTKKHDAKHKGLSKHKSREGGDVDCPRGFHVIDQHPGAAACSDTTYHWWVPSARTAGLGISGVREPKQKKPQENGISECLPQKVPGEGWELPS